jgi:hypothetical protein
MNTTEHKAGLRLGLKRDNQAFSKAEKANGPKAVHPKYLHEARAVRDAVRIT